MPWLVDSTGLAFNTKDPSDINDYVIDMTAWCAEKVDTVVSTVWTIVDGSGSPVNKVSDTYTAAGVLAIWLQGGTVGTVAQVRVVFTTAAGRKRSKTFNLRIATQ